MALFDKEFNEYREKNESFEKTWMASSINDVAKWALIFGFLGLVIFVEKTCHLINGDRLYAILNWKFEVIGFVLDIISLIATCILISFAFKYKKAFKKGDETTCIRLIGLLKSFFVWVSALVLFGFALKSFSIFTK